MVVKLFWGRNNITKMFLFRCFDCGYSLTTFEKSQFFGFLEGPPYGGPSRIKVSLQKVSKSLKYLSDPHFQNLHVEIYKKHFYLTAISSLLTAVGSGEECAWLQSATEPTVRYRAQHLTLGKSANWSDYDFL